MELAKFMKPNELEKTGAILLNLEQQRALLDWGMRMFTLGQSVSVVGDIESIKYDGRLIVLDDGTRWEVDSIDATTSELWSEGGRVAVIDDEMYLLDDLEKVAVSLEE